MSSSCKYEPVMIMTMIANTLRFDIFLASSLSCSIWSQWDFDVNPNPNPRLDPSACQPRYEGADIMPFSNVIRPFE